LSSNDSVKLHAVLEEVTFIPTPQMRRTKANYWATLAENPVYDRETTTLASALEVTRDTRLSKWWSVPGFTPWFTNREEFRQRLEYLANLALDTIEEVLLDSDANANARMRAVQLALEAAAKMPGKSDNQKMLDDRVQKMGRAELEAFIRQHANLVGATPNSPLDTESET
jgi:hypothetical protein